jgi:hypothetical protein
MARLAHYSESSLVVLSSYMVRISQYSAVKHLRHSERLIIIF